MELKQYLFPLRRWWWLILASTLLAAVSSFVVTLQQPPVYQARTTLMIGRAIEDPNPSASQFWLTQQLATAYADVANRDGVRNATMSALGLNFLPEYRARALANSQVIEVIVTDVVPERAAIVANELANQLILQSPTGIQSEENDRQEFVNEQLDTLEAQIQQTQDDIEKAQADLGNMVSARQINDTQNQISALQAKLTALQSNYANLLANTQRGAVNTLSVIEPAAPPRRPIGPAKMASILVAAFIGMALATGAAYLLEYLDDTLKIPEDIQRAIGYPVIGYVAETKQHEEKPPFILRHPRHPFSESFRSLRTNLEFTAVDRPLKTILVTSADSEEGKTSVAVNLAVVMAQGDKRVLLVDADLRKPGIHDFMQLRNEEGLSEIFIGRSSPHASIRVWKEERVGVLTAGSPPPNPAELLASRKMDQILANLRDLSDYVIIDGPPFVVTDAAVLAAKVDGVLIVVRPGYTREAAAQAMMEQIRRAGAKVIGVVLNGIPDKLAGYYGGQLHLYSYYSDHYVEYTRPADQGRNGPLGWLQKLTSRYGQEVRGSFRQAPPRRDIQQVETPKRGNK